MGCDTKPLEKKVFLALKYARPACVDARSRVFRGRARGRYSKRAENVVQLFVEGQNSRV